MFWRVPKIRHESQIVPSLEEFTPAPEDIDDEHVPARRGITYGPIWLRTCSHLAGPHNRLSAFSTMELHVSRLTGIGSCVSQVTELTIGSLEIQGVEELHFLLAPGENCKYELAAEIAAAGILLYLQGYDQKESGAIGDMVKLANAHEIRTPDEIARIRSEFAQAEIIDQGAPED